ncbi:hypothetical protein [Deinococcus hopiensis]|uniref:Uncharacterized protein n=1 Tax=Deinococcus hopiensis KR-140 TaxID=695939 RepID=A0A1W1UY42_9DEIO|nr:hypothetical protein [Deinococcus hopiensis]SMB85880.1 hypothetical protein SAMN00790413_03584 [Deinococcus hopiensis KR-140]
MHPEPQTVPHLPTSVATTLQTSIRTSLKDLARQSTPANERLTAQYQAILAALHQHQPLTPEQLRLLQRSLWSTQALAETGCPIEGRLSRHDLDQAHATLHLHMNGASARQLVA